MISISIIVFFLGLICLGGIESSGQVGAFLLPLLLIILVVVFLFFLLNFCKSLKFFYLVIFKVFLKKIVELRLYYWVFSFRVIFMLVPLLDHHFTKKWDSKKDFVLLIDLNNFKIIIILLAKMVRVEIKILIIEVGKFGFKKPLMESGFLGMVLF